MAKFSILLSAVLILATTPSRAEEMDDEAETHEEMLHSSLPLYDFDWEDFWPRGFADDEGFGCLSRVAFGDWRFDPNDAEEEDPQWYRFGNYGVFHCAAHFSTDWDRAELDNAPWEYGFFVKLGDTTVEAEVIELWAIQEGTRPGSKYLLLARRPSEGIVVSFLMLQSKCPEDRLVEAPSGSLDIWLTRYCRIEKRGELLSLAERMVRLPPLGEIRRVEDEKEGPGDVSPGPSEND